MIVKCFVLNKIFVINVVFNLRFREFVKERVEGCKNWKMGVFIIVFWIYYNYYNFEYM